MDICYQELNSTMKYLLLLILFFSCASVLLAQQPSQNHKIVLPSRELTLLELIKAVEGQTSWRFAYDPKAIPIRETVMLANDRIAIEEIISLISDRFRISCTFHGNSIILKRGKTTKSVTIYGHVRDADSGENLIQATLLERNSGRIAVSNDYGYYSLSVPADQSVSLLYSYVGYEPVALELSARVDTLVNASLPISTLEEVVVNGSGVEAIHESVQMSRSELPVQQIKAVPAMGGETDVMKVLQLLPGVKAGNEGTTGLYVRGGGPDQNLFLLDGVPVYNVSHLFGFFSTFNSDAIKHVDILKGAFPARYGGRLSSVVDISMKDGNQTELHGEASIGLIASRLTLEGPIKSNKSSYVFSARRTFADAFIPLVNKLKPNLLPAYYFYDLNAKVNHTFSSKDRIYLSAYLGQDRLRTKGDNDYTVNEMALNSDWLSQIKWGNLVSAIRWNHVYSPKLFSNTTLTYSEYKYDTRNDYDYQELDVTTGAIVDRLNSNSYHSGIKDIAGRIDVEYQWNDRHYLTAGTYLVRHQFSPGVTAIKNTSSEVFSQLSDIPAFESQVYVSDEISIGSRLKANLGVHAANFNVRSKNYFSTQPRLSARYLLGEKLSLKASYSTMAQFIHLLTNVGINLPTDLWVPTTDVVRPQKAWQGAFGVAYQLKGGYEFSAEGYYKEMENVIEYKDGADLLSPGKNWENQVESGRGWSYGSEFLIHKKAGKFNGWVGYTLSWSERKFENINFGQAFPFRYDRRHDLSMVVGYKKSKRFEVGGTFVFATGAALSLPQAAYVMEENGYEYIVDHYTGRNQYRMANYHRMDLSGSWHKKKKHGTRTWVVSIYNVYNRRNPYMIISSAGGSGGTNTRSVWTSKSFNQFTLFPVLPSISYQFTF
jgi:TonB-dependent Receptor Plug Domain/CarboxypepD_reg-like domain